MKLMRVTSELVLLLLDEQFDLAMNDLTRAIGLVEQVMNTLSTADQWSTFLHQYTELYAQTAITQVRRNQDSEALSTLSVVRTYYR